MATIITPSRKGLVSALVLAASCWTNPSLAALRGVSENVDAFCPTQLPILHDFRLSSDGVINNYVEDYGQWLESEFYPFRNIGTFRHDDLYVTLPEGTNLIYWEQRQGKDQNWDKVELDLSAWYTDPHTGLHQVQNGTFTAGNYTWNFVDPKEALDVMEPKTIVLQGNHALYLPPWMGLYQHALIDHLGYLIYMKETLPSDTRFLMPRVRNSQLLHAMIQRIDFDLSCRIDYIDCDNLISCQQTVDRRYQVQDGTLKILLPKSPTQHLQLYQKIRSWFWKSRRIQKLLSEQTTDEKVVIYYKRPQAKSKEVHIQNARHMNEEQESHILQAIEHALVRYNRPEKLVVFDGSLNFKEQIQLFTSATTVIGPHGGGLANMILLPPSSSCEQRPRVLEFITNRATPEVQGGGSVKASFFSWYSTCPWIELHQIMFTPPSNGEETFIDMKTFQQAIKVLFGPSQNNSQISSTKQ